MARFLAKNIVGCEIVKKCLIQLSYAIGIAEPISIYLRADKKSDVDEKRLVEIKK